MSRKKVSTTVYLDPDQYERLRILTERTKVPTAEYIRQGIDLRLDRESSAALPVAPTTLADPMEVL